MSEPGFLKIDEAAELTMRLRNDSLQ